MNGIGLKYGFMWIVTVIATILLQCNLHGQSATLKIVVDVPSASVYLDGNYVEATDENGKLFLSGLHARDYVLEVRKDGYAPFSQSVTLGELTKTVRVSLIREERLEPPLPSKPTEVASQGDQDAQLRISTNAGGALVYIDGRLATRTDSSGYALISIPAGRRDLSVRRQGFQDYQEQIDFLPDLTVKRTINLIPGRMPDGPSSWLVFTLAGLLAVLVSLMAFLLLHLTSSPRRLRAKFDRYILERVLGRGGMATIYKARDTKTGLRVALKVMDIGYLNDQDLVKKFIREGEVLMELNRDFPDAPLVRVFRFGRENNKTYGRPFIAMEILKGRNLLEVIRLEKQLGVDFALAVVGKVALALRAAHSRGIYHRDVTPDNIVLIKNDSSAPEIRLIDFGVARHEYTSAGTLDGTISGKPPYMSPEQCRGEKVDGRSDIYSLGIILYTLITGAPPFSSNNPLEVMRHHEKTPVPPIRRDIAEGVLMVAAKMLEKDPAARFQSANDLIDALDNSAI